MFVFSPFFIPQKVMAFTFKSAMQASDPEMPTSPSLFLFICLFCLFFFFNAARSVLCNDPDMYEIPVNVPVDTVKLRIEKTVIRRIPTEAFYYLVDLKYLWVTYNCVANIDISSFYNLKQLHELRLDGNLLSTFPWESLAEMPNLRTLDLHNNKMTSIPADAGKYLRNLTYLDISSNKLTTLPSDLMDIWPPFSETIPSKSADILVTQRVILGMLNSLSHSLLECI